MSGTKLQAMACLAGACLLLTTATGARAEPLAPPAYEMGFRNITNIHADLVLALDRKQRALIAPATLLLPAVQLPCIASLPGGAKNSPGGPVQLSAGFVEFLNRVAHAKAIDETERGFFTRYTTQISTQTQNGLVPDIEGLSSAGTRSFQTMNRQASHFNQMAGGLVAIDLAHHYLGHYTAHAQELPGQSELPMPVNALITEKEWREAVLRGAHNALSCGLGLDGLKAVFECFERMPQRPSWSLYFIHPKANVSKINAELGRIERDFFMINETLHKTGRR